MHTSLGKIVMKSKPSLVFLAAIALASCSSSPTPDQPAVSKADKPFAAGGSIELQLDGGDYAIRPSSDEHIRVSFAGNTSTAAADLSTSGAHANLAIKDTPHNN